MFAAMFGILPWCVAGCPAGTTDSATVAAPPPEVVGIEQLTKGIAVHRNPRLSWDGEKVAFESHTFRHAERVDPDHPSDRSDIAWMPLSGGEPRIVPDSDGGQEPSWTRDGRLLYQRSSDLILTAPDGTGRDQRPMAQRVATVARPVVSPDGRYVAFLTPPESRVDANSYDPARHASQAHVFDLKADTIRQVSFLTSNWTSEYMLDWADDTTLLAYRHEQGRNARFHRVTAIRIPANAAQAPVETLGWFSDLMDITRVDLASRRVLTTAFRPGQLAALAFNEQEGALLAAPKPIFDVALAPGARRAVVSMLDVSPNEPGRPVHLFRVDLPSALQPIAGVVAAVDALPKAVPAAP